MLDNITKKNIDDCRDVLVGKVPEPLGDTVLKANVRLSPLASLV